MKRQTNRYSSERITRGMLILVCLCCCFIVNAQISIQNGSFEKTPPSSPPIEWIVWNGSPDIQPGAFCVTLPPYDGISYLGLVTGGNNPEAVGQLLSSPIIKGKTYKFSVALSMTNSTVLNCGGVKFGPSEFQLRGANVYLEIGTLLWKSDTIDHVGWVVYKGMFTADSNYSYLLISMRYLTPVAQNVYLLVDKLSDFEEVIPSVAFSSPSNGDALSCTEKLSGMIVGSALKAEVRSVYLSKTIPANLPNDSSWTSGGFEYPSSCVQQKDSLYVTAYFPSDTVTMGIKVQVKCLGDTCEEPVIPNLITPNGDGKNDALEILNLPLSHRIELYNRWGQRLLESTAYKNDWQGEDGVYYYLLTLEDKQYKGWVQVIRE